MKKNQNTNIISPIVVALIVILAAQTVALYFFSPHIVFRAALAVCLGVAVFAGIYMLRVRKNMYKFVTGLADSLESAGSGVLTNFSMPVLITHQNETDSIVWYNDAFRRLVTDGKEIFGESAHFILSENIREALSAAGSCGLEYKDKHFVIYKSVSEIDDTEYAVYYLADDTRLKRTADEYTYSRPCVGYITVDNLDEIMVNLRESEKAELTVLIEREIESFAAKTTGIIKKIGNGKFLVITENRHLHRMMDEKFNILERVRSIDHVGRSSPTLSIGMGQGGTLSAAEESAKSALDMALGRGGDQAAVKLRNGEFQFFGGVSAATERRTKVRSRVVAQAVRELIEGSDRVLIMGHRFADLDAFGAAVGFYSVCRQLGREASVVMTRSTSLAIPLLTRLENNGIRDFVMEPEEALPLITKKTLLIVVDTHRGDFVDSEEIYKACDTVVVVDHHRKTVNYIDNAVIFYHEPFASSASEMASELIEYIGGVKLGRFEAEALLAGIMLDTRNFVLRTGVRTFEASAYLRSRGADPVEVKRLFAGSMETYRERSAIVGDAEIYKNCAISTTSSDFPDIRIATSQAADELLNIESVNASFVIFINGGEVNISARSLGAVNVQLIMEKLSGGGHQTMAAAQLPGETLETAQMLLMQAIDNAIISE